MDNRPNWKMGKWETPDPLERKQSSQQKAAEEKRLAKAREKAHDKGIAELDRVNRAMVNAKRIRY